MHDKDFNDYMETSSTISQADMVTQSVKIELTVSNPEIKPKIKQIIYNIFAELEINDEKDCFPLSYAVDKSNDLVHKVIIYFKNENVGNKFHEFINNPERLSSNNFSSIYKNPLDNFGDFEHVSSNITNSSCDSIFVINDDSYQRTPSLTIETSMCASSSVRLPFERQDSLEKPINKSLNKIKSSHEDINKTVLSESIVSGHSSKHDNLNETVQDEDNNVNVVEFYSSKAIEDNDLELVIMFLENKRASGGGDTESHELDATRKILNVKYESKNSKKRVMERNILEFRDYKLIPNEQFNESLFTLDTCTVILKNISSQIDKNLVQIFAENLVVNDNEANDVENVQCSSLFPDIFYVKYKLGFDMNKMRMRLQRRPKLAGRIIEIVPTFVTNTVVVRMIDENNQKISSELIELYFFNKKRSGAETFKSARERGQFMLITFEDKKSVESVLAKKHVISNHELIVEPLFNLDLVNEYSDAPILTSNKEVSKLADEKPNLVEEKKVEAIKVETPLQVIESKVPDQIPQEINLTKFKIAVDLDDQPNLKVVYNLNDRHFDQLVEELFENDAFCSKRNDVEYGIMIEYTEKLPENLEDYETLKTIWTEKIKEILNQFFNQFDTQTVENLNSDSLEKGLDYDKFRVNLSKIDEFKFEIIGFKDHVKHLKEEICKINRESVEKNNKNEDEIIKEEVTGLKLYEARVLFVNRFIRTMRSIYDTISIRIIPQTGVVQLQGTRKQIEHAKNEINNIIKLIKCKRVPVDEVILQFIMHKEKSVVDWLKEREILCTLEVDFREKLVFVYSTDDKQLENCSSSIQRNIVLQEIESDLCEDVRDDQKLLDFIEESNKAEGVYVCLSNNKSIKICGFEDSVNQIYNKFFELIH